MINEENGFIPEGTTSEWISLAQNAAPGAHTFILEDFPEIPDSLPPDQNEGARSDSGDELENIYGPGCTPVEQSRIQGMPGGQATASEMARQQGHASNVRLI
jgi:hypothetical protein